MDIQEEYEVVCGVFFLLNAQKGEGMQQAAEDLHSEEVEVEGGWGVGARPRSRCRWWQVVQEWRWGRWRAQSEGEEEWVMGKEKWWWYEEWANRQDDVGVGEKWAGVRVKLP